MANKPNADLLLQGKPSHSGCPCPGRAPKMKKTWEVQDCSTAHKEHARACNVTQPCSQEPRSTTRSAFRSGQDNHLCSMRVHSRTLAHLLSARWLGTGTALLKTAPKKTPKGLRRHCGPTVLVEPADMGATTAAEAHLPGASRKEGLLRCRGPDGLHSIRSRESSDVHRRPAARIRERRGALAAAGRRDVGATSSAEQDDVLLLVLGLGPLRPTPGGPRQRPQNSLGRSARPAPAWHPPSSRLGTCEREGSSDQQSCRCTLCEARARIGAQSSCRATSEPGQGVHPRMRSLRTRTRSQWAIRLPETQCIQLHRRYEGSRC
mmetsp:Transcript_119812/g.382461  ORF Transcript_119812/g.382461 Transcript_119812/m.382461 type:complete len:320 (+) Transcript_119812:65-1024(+)